MAKLNGIESYQVDDAENALVKAWDNAYKVMHGLGGLEHYKEFSKHRYLGTINFLVTQISAEGALDTDQALQSRQEEPGFNLEIFERAVDDLVQYWPEIASLIVQIG